MTQNDYTNPRTCVLRVKSEWTQEESNIDIIMTTDKYIPIVEVSSVSDCDRDSDSGRVLSISFTMSSSACR